MDETLQKNNKQDDIPKPEPVKASIFNKPHFIEWMMMFILTFMWVLGTHFTFILSNQFFPFFNRVIKSKHKLNIWKLVMYKILLFSLFAYFFETMVVSNIVYLFVNNFFATPDTKIHYLSASLGITLGLFSGLKLKTIIK